MATLTGQKIKDAYQTLLKLESGTLTGSTKIVEDGAGNDSALKLSTTEVEVDGALTFTSAPPASATELTALLIDGATNDVVTPITVVPLVTDTTGMYCPSITNSSLF